ncbi:MAG: hypothetical protein PVI21_05825 [Candidatus Woesebacteria bacterium]|jgi:hypothetical protein
MTAIDDLPEVAVSEFDEKSIVLQPARGEFFKILILGIVTGALLPFASNIVNKFLVVPVFCQQEDTLAMCSDSETVCYYILSVIFAITAVALLAKWQVFRPLLIAVGVTVSLWGFGHYVQNLVGGSALEYYLASTVLYASAYLLFYFIMRMRIFAFSVGLLIAVVAALRFMLVS